jgi:hypothetical protein
MFYLAYDEAFQAALHGLECFHAFYFKPAVGEHGGNFRGRKADVQVLLQPVYEIFN